MIQISLVFSAVACISSLIFGILTAVDRFKKSNSKDTASLTTVIVKLENIGNGISEIKSEIINLKAEVSENRERIIKAEESVKQAHKRIDGIK